MNKICTTLLIGNGLGMAVNHEYFQLSKGLQHAWDNLDEDTEKRILQFTNNERITSERQLRKHYDAIELCVKLRQMEIDHQIPWLNNDARDFPEKFLKFIENTAWYFFRYSETGFYNLNTKDLLIKFISNLTNYILKENTNIATLNYDGLIYETIINNHILMDTLTDGFFTNKIGFKYENLKSRPAVYLHLHGSPLFYYDEIKNIFNKGRIKWTPLQGQFSSEFKLAPAFMQLLGAAPFPSHSHRFLPVH